MIIDPPTPRPNKLYFETLDASDENEKAKTRHRWVLKSANGKVIGASHISFISKKAAIRNCVSVFNSNVIEESRIFIVDPEMRKKVVEEAYAMLDHN